MHLRLVPALVPASDPDDEYRLTLRQTAIVAAMASLMADDVYDDIDELGEAPVVGYSHQISMCGTASRWRTRLPGPLFLHLGCCTRPGHRRRRAHDAFRNANHSTAR